MNMHDRRVTPPGTPMRDGRVTPPGTPLTPDRRVWSERLVRISGFRRFLPTQAWQRAFPFVVLVSTLVLVGVLTWVLSGIIQKSDEANFEQSIEQAHREIKRRMDVAVGLVRATSALSMAGQLTPEMFRAFVNQLGSLEAYPGIQSIGFCQRFEAARRAEVNRRLAADYGPDVKLIQRHAGSAEGFAVFYVEPFNQNRWALGWDMYDEQGVRRLAMESARVDDAPRVSRRTFLPVDLTLEARAPGFYAFMPVYEGNLPLQTPFERKLALVGFTYCSVIVDGFFEGVFAKAPASIVFRVYDGKSKSPDELIYESPHRRHDSTREPKTRELSLYGVTWTIDYETQPEFEKTSSSSLIPWILIGGIVSSFVIFLATFALVHARMDSERIEGILREKTAELARSNTDLERFAYVASHDLREPLRMITSYVQLLEKRYSDKLDEDARAFIAFAVDGAKRMNDFLDGLLYLSRVTRDPGVHDPVDSEQVLKKALENLKGAIQDSHAVVTNDPLPAARINETHLLQLFQNLIGNAIKFQKPGATAHVHVSASLEESFVRFSIRDNGIGIDPAFAGHAFDVFRKYHTRDQYPGSGIGLTICKRIVEQRGGKIGFESSPGVGTTFWFTLPAA
jgi:signal transduction histidine kinase